MKVLEATKIIVLSEEWQHGLDHDAAKNDRTHRLWWFWAMSWSGEVADDCFLMVHGATILCKTMHRATILCKMAFRATSKHRGLLLCHGESHYPDVNAVNTLCIASSKVIWKLFNSLAHQLQQRTQARSTMMCERLHSQVLYRREYRSADHKVVFAQQSLAVHGLVSASW